MDVRESNREAARVWNGVFLLLLFSLLDILFNSITHMLGLYAWVERERVGREERDEMR